MPLAAIIGFTILSHAAFNGSRVTVSLYALHLQATPFTVGVLMSLYALLPMLLSVPAGRLIDRIGARKPVLWSALMVILGVFLPWAWPGLPALYVASTLIGTGFMILHLAVNNVVGALGGPADRTRNFSWLAIGFSVSGFLGPMIAGFSIDNAGHLSTFLILTGIAGCAFALFSRTHRLFAQRGAHVAASPDAPKPRVADLLANRRMRAVFIASGLLSTGWDLFTFMIPIYCSQAGLSASTIGVIMGAFAAATFAVRLLMPLFAGRLKEWHVITASMLVAGVAYSLYPFFQTTGPLVALSCLLGAGLGCAQPMVMALLYAASPPGRQGEAIGIRTTVLNISSTVLPLVSGALGAALGMGPVFWMMSALLCTGGYAAARKSRRAAHRKAH